jgi:ribokinase
MLGQDREEHMLLKSWNRVLNFGSLNIDYVYRVDHFVRPGETLDSLDYRVFQGGKGANQSVALARAGARVFHAGKVGPEGRWLVGKLKAAGVNTRHVLSGDSATGHAVIQVDKGGQNAIVLHGGANRDIPKAGMARILSAFGPGTLLLLQNEINDTAFLIQKAKARGMGVCLNPAPFHDAVKKYPLGNADILIVNETEGQGLSGAASPEKIMAALRRKYPSSAILLTLGSKGLVYADRERSLRLPALRVKARDTTAAGDCFIGFFLAGLTGGRGVRESLELGTRAAALSVTRPGAADSIPLLKEAECFRGK